VGFTVPTRRHLSFVGALALVVTAGLTALPTTAVQQQPPQPPPQPTFRAEANYVRVDVFPTKDGAPVLDLTREDFEVFESGAPQKLEQFEHVVIRAAGPQDTRIEPNTVAESRAMAENPRARVFVVFLDTYHVDVGASHNIRRPLIDALDRVIGQDDLVGVMTPEMSARDIAFARKTRTIEGFLTRYWHWGERDRMIPPDPEDAEYGFCYPNRNQGECTDQNGVAAEMIDRRHEKRAIDALRDLVVFLGGVREERKAILAITNGWLLYRPNPSLARPLNCHGVPTGPIVSVDPRSGKLTTKEPGTNYSPNRTCEIDRLNLAQIDDATDFRELLDQANRANASFYPVDPRGLAVFDTPMMRTDVPGPPAPMVPLTVDAAMLRGRVESLRTLAEATDGLAIVNSNDIASGLKRAVADLSSYYLLGYYSTGKLDGKFHPISVRVKRPGVQVRARRGYLAATPGAITAAARSAAAAPKPVDAEALAVQAALAPLADAQRELPLRIHATAGWRPFDSLANRATAGFWVVAEFAGAAAQDRNVDVTVVGPSGSTVGHASGGGSGRSVLVPVSPSEPAVAGEYTVRVRSDGAGTGTVRITLPAAPDAGGAVFMRRGPATGNKDMPTADLRFRRNERIRVELPTLDGAAVTVRLLDRTGKALAIPLTATRRDDGDGSRWQTTELALAPLAPGDYVIEMAGAAGAGSEKRTLAAFRIVP
jgi:VWFA-related protein